jgi:hypothetical protein
MHLHTVQLKVLLTAGAASASLLAGTAGSVLLGHAASSPSSQNTVQPTPHHISAPNHAGGTRGKRNTGMHKYHGTGHLNGKPAPNHNKKKHHPKPAPTSSPSPSPHP